MYLLINSPPFFSNIIHHRCQLTLNIFTNEFSIFSSPLMHRGGQIRAIPPSALHPQLPSKGPHGPSPHPSHQRPVSPASLHREHLQVCQQSNADLKLINDVAIIIIGQAESAYVYIHSLAPPPNMHFLPVAPPPNIHFLPDQ